MEEELDFIINYDIKYRMGDELGEEGESESQQKPETRESLQASRPPKQHEQRIELKEEKHRKC